MMHATESPLQGQLVLTILAVTDVPLAKAFYQRAFGWPVTVDVPVYVEFTLPDGRRFGLYERQAFGLNTGQVPEARQVGALSTTELYFHCDRVEDALVRLEDAGARLLSPLALRLWGDEAAYFADPDGNVLVIARERH